MIPHVHVETSRSGSIPLTRAAPSIRAFTDKDAGLLRCSRLIGDTDEWCSTGQRIRVYRNGSTHFAVCEVSATGRPHPSIVRMVPDAIGVPGCSVIVSIPDDQIDDLLGALR